jgi:hypothetical protein
MPLTKKDFNTEIENIFRQADALGLSYIGLCSGKLHRKLGGYPGKNMRMPVCCACMRKKLRPDAGDRTIEAPPKGDGATLLIQYVIPRP